MYDIPPPPHTKFLRKPLIVFTFKSHYNTVSLCAPTLQPFTLNTPDRHWIFAGDLSRVEGRSVRSYWALLFSDILLFTKVSRDRVLFVTDEPLPLSSIAQIQFSVKKKGTPVAIVQLRHVDRSVRLDGHGRFRPKTYPSLFGRFPI
jgi:hypothetical protein